MSASAAGSKNGFTPRIVGFLCNWCSYTGADAAGRAQKAVPAGLRIIRTMCSGRVDPQWIMDAFQNGADGVLVLGCHPGDCHYKEGNIKTLRRMAVLQRVLRQMGVEEGRVRLDWVSAAEAEKFQRVATEMVETVRRLGPYRAGDRR